MVRKRTEWAANVAGYINRPAKQFNRTSALHQPGRWACQDPRGWAHHGRPEFEPAEGEVSDEVCSGVEQLDDERMFDEDNSSSSNTLPANPMPQRQTGSRESTLSIADDSRPSASHLDHKAKRRYLEAIEHHQRLLRSLKNVSAQLEAVKD